MQNKVNLICACGAQSTHWCSVSWDGLNVADSAWHTVWLHGDWRELTRHMDAGQRTLAADAVARHSRRLALQDGDGSHTEPANLRWWLAPA
ncbi:hypothetical protein [Streptomyces sp. NPDC001492]